MISENNQIQDNNKSLENINDQKSANVKNIKISDSISTDSLLLHELPNLNQQLENQREKSVLIVQNRILEQQDRLNFVDKSECYGIPTNIYIINKYIDLLYSFVIENNKFQFIRSINTPFGFAQA